MENIKTTVIGFLVGGGVSLDALVTQGLQHGWKQALLGLGVAVLGWVAKDHNKS